VFARGDKVRVLKNRRHTGNYPCLKPVDITRIPARCIACPVAKTGEATVHDSCPSPFGHYFLLECAIDLQFKENELVMRTLVVAPKELVPGTKVMIRADFNSNKLCENPTIIRYPSYCGECDVPRNKGMAVISRVTYWGINRFVDVKTSAPGGTCKFAVTKLVGDYGDIHRRVVDREIKANSNINPPPTRTTSRATGRADRRRSSKSTYLSSWRERYGQCSIPISWGNHGFEVKKPQLHTEDRLPEITDKLIDELEG
jgi:hypothetical protein